MAHGILMHEPNDDVGIAVRDLKTGEEVSAITLEGQPVGAVKMVNDVPLGHKVAMKDIAAGKDVIKYNRVIGIATQAAPRGSHVHTHNLKTKRWKV